jgi:LAO/AO transport system kinase
MTVEGLIAGIRRRDTTALARAISLVENGRDGYEELLSTLHGMLGKAHRIGVTGPPGAGKSTLTERLIRGLRDRGQRVAVVAVDPTSPFSGGALLGDRIRMESVSLDPEVYIRSMATRGGVGGLATTSREVCDVLDAFGFDRIIIETVGVGQSELAIAATADSAVLVLVPESGDGIQVLKAGVMEIADVYVVNKADRPGADRLQQEIEVMLGLRKGQAYRHVGTHHGTDRPTGPPGEGWEPPVLATVATAGSGVGEVIDAIETHRHHLERTGELNRRRRARLERLTREVVDRSLRRLVWEEGRGESVLREGLDAVVRGVRSPYQLARDIVAASQREDAHEPR